MTDLNTARAVAARLRTFADSVRNAERIDYEDDWGTGADLAELLDLAAATIDELIGDEYDGPTELHPILEPVVTIELDLPDPTWPTAEQMMGTTVRLHPEGYFTAEPRGPVEPGGDDTPGV